MKCPTASPVGVALLEEAPLCALPAIVTATPAAALPVSARLAALEALAWLALRTGSSEAALRAAAAAHASARAGLLPLSTPLSAALAAQLHALQALPPLALALCADGSRPAVSERCMHHGTVTGAPVLAGLPTPLRTWATAHLRIAPVPPDTTAKTPAEVAPGLCVLCTSRSRAAARARAQSAVRS